MSHDLIDLNEIALMAGCSRRHIDDLRREDESFPKVIPSLGRRLLFRRIEVAAWLDRRLRNEPAKSGDSFKAGLEARPIGGAV